jgi:beta-N-acetylhexosaminidase
MVDQEGGSVTRVRVSTPLPSALALAQVPDAKFIEDYAKTNAELLMTLGFNVNLAPVMDLSNPTVDTFIANRSFGDDPKLVSESAMAYARGIAAGGMIPTAKHFPGHGGLSGDSHHGSAKKLATVEELESRDWIPFADFSAADFPKAIMMAHLSLPEVDPSGVPATYSRVLIKDYLRDKIGYQGLVITDDLEMGGASISSDMGERAVRAFLAGNDMIMLAGIFRNQKRAFDSMVAAVKSGRIPKERLNDSVRRILELKDRPRFANSKFEQKKTNEIKIRLEGLSKKIMQKNFKDSLDSKTSQWPQIRGEDEVLVMSSDRRFYNHFSVNVNGKARYMRLSPATMDYARAEITKPKYSLVVYYASGSKTAKWLTGISPEIRSKILVVNCNHAGKVEAQDTFMGVLNLNSASPESGGWLARALSAPPDLRLPAGQNRQTSVGKPKAPVVIDDEPEELPAASLPTDPSTDVPQREPSESPNMN